MPFLSPLKKSKNLWLSDIFRGFRTGTLVSRGSSTYFLIKDFVLKQNAFITNNNKLGASIVVLTSNIQA